MDAFDLYDLRIEVVATGRPMVCSHREGDYFDVQGENLVFDTTRTFSLYALAALLPLIPAKQRHTDAADWMSTDHMIACPDPHCGAQFRITRLEKRTFRHDDVTTVPLERWPAGSYLSAT